MARHLVGDTHKRAIEIYHSMRVTCSCGGDPRHPGWHHEGCSTDQAWDVAVSQAEDEAIEKETDDVA